MIARLAELAPCATTGIGSLPLADPADAVAHVWSANDLPYAPQLPLHGDLISPSSPAALSNSRSEVVPTAISRPPSARAAFSRSAVARSILPHSACMRWSAVSSALTGRNVPAPTWRVNVSRATPRSASISSKRSVK